MAPTGAFLFALSKLTSFLGSFNKFAMIAGATIGAILPAMLDQLTPEQEHELIQDLATRAGTGAEIASWYGTTRGALEAFVEAHRPQLEAARRRAEAPPDESPDVVPPAVLDELWITNKAERIRRAQECADILYRDIQANSYEGAELATALREFRSYCVWVSNELGQLMHRGAGDAGTGDSLDINIEGVDMNALR